MRNWELADKRLSPGEKIEQWNLRMDTGGILACWDSTDPYCKVFEKREDHC